MKKKFPALFLCLCLVAATMTGCGGSPAPQPIPDEEPSVGEEILTPEALEEPPTEGSNRQPEAEDPSEGQETRSSVLGGWLAGESTKDYINPAPPTQETTEGQSTLPPVASAAEAPKTQAPTLQPQAPAVGKQESEAEDETLSTASTKEIAVNVNDYSESYQNSVYYQRLKAVTLTGSYRDDLLAVAESQLGYHESSDKSKLDGSGSGNGNYTEYGRFCGTNGTAWCSEFASWCARQAGIPTSVLGTSASARASKFGGTYHPWSDTVYAGGNFQPRPGDLVFFAWSKSSLTADAKDHTAIFVSDDWRSSDSLVIYTLDGNSSDAVRRNTRIVLDQSSGTVGGGWIAGFIAPNYGDGDGTVKVTTPKKPSTESKPDGTTTKSAEEKKTEQPVPEEKVPAEEKPVEEPVETPSEEPEEDDLPEEETPEAQPEEPPSDVPEESDEDDVDAGE